jgi:DTW domain-containing protein YfiP
MRVDLCLCAEIQPVSSRLRVVVVMHAKEANKPTNTAFLARAMLQGTEIRLRGARGGERIELDDLPDAGVLFPLEEAQEISASNAPPILLVPDGTWPQARSAVRRELMRFPCFKLPEGTARECSMRAHYHPSSVSTFEAIARVVDTVGDHAAADAMMRVFRLMVERTMMTRAGAPIRIPPREDA